MAERALIVDLDGTVWDSAGWYASLAGMNRGSGMPAARMLKSVGFTEARLARAALANPPPLYEGVEDFIRIVPGPLGVVTNLPGWMVRPMLAAVGLAGVFDAVVDFGATRAHKPNPAPLLRCAELLGRAPMDCVYVSDEPGDGVAAHGAGMPFAWASWGYTRVEPGEYDLRLDRLFDLAPMFLVLP